MFTIEYYSAKYSGMGTSQAWFPIDVRPDHETLKSAISEANRCSGRVRIVDDRGNIYESYECRVLGHPRQGEIIWERWDSEGNHHGEASQ